MQKDNYKWISFIDDVEFFDENGKTLFIIQGNKEYLVEQKEDKYEVHTRDGWEVKFDVNDPNIYKEEVDAV